MSEKVIEKPASANDMDKQGSFHCINLGNQLLASTIYIVTVNFVVTLSDHNRISKKIIVSFGFSIILLVRLFKSHFCHGSIVGPSPILLYCIMTFFMTSPVLRLNDSHPENFIYKLDLNRGP